MSKSGRELLWWIGGLFLLLVVWSPAAEGWMAGVFWTDGGDDRSLRDADPSYRIYERYRYAYDTYGYLFLSAETGAEAGQYEKDAVGGLMQEREAQVPGQAQGFSQEQGFGQVREPGQMQGAGEESGGSGQRAATGVLPSFAQLADYDFLMKQFYSVHPSTTAPRQLMRAEAFLGTDLSLVQDASVPQVLIYHTHSQEAYADFGPSNPEATVVGVGNYLTQLLQEKGWNVIHDISTYDIQGGSLDRSRAYTYALDGVEKLLQKYPSIQVVLDLHRDGVGEKVRLVSEVGGKQTANIMFFQGMSRTPEGEIEYLPNPNLEGNLAFSFQLQFAAAGYYPGFTRKIYLKGLRYNLHLRPRSSLIEVGAQTNTFEEARNAMEPLAEVLDMVLQGK